jgi:hypothetical protein
MLHQEIPFPIIVASWLEVRKYWRTNDEILPDLVFYLFVPNLFEGGANSIKTRE